MVLEGNGEDFLSVADLNADGYTDILLTGDGILRILRNSNGESLEAIAVIDTILDLNIYSSFFDDEPLNFINSIQGHSFVDFNQDNQIDICLYIKNQENRSTIYILLNQGNFKFKLVHNLPLDFKISQITISDLNNDGLEELLISGYTDLGNSLFDPRFSIYSLGKNGFSHINNSIKKLLNSNYIVLDFESDGSKDILATGTDISGNNHTIFYFNNNPGKMEYDEVIYEYTCGKNKNKRN
ncbi:FG-GAP repeat domain-containing protein [Bacteroidota bacterium]